VQRFEEEAFGGLGVPCRAQEKLQRVADRESTARERYVQIFLMLMDVSSTRQESVVALRCGRHRLSSSGAERLPPAVHGGMIDALVRARPSSPPDRES